MGGVAIGMGSLLLLSLPSDAAWVALCANVLALLLAVVVIASSALLAARGSRTALMLLLSWLSLVVFTSMRALELPGVWVGASWLGQAIAISFVAAAMMLTLGLLHHVRALLRDRDQASARADVDALTSVASRVALERCLRQAFIAAQASEARLCVACFDIDYFKTINDRYGHQAGDYCLQEVCLRIRGHLGEGDVLGRYGGDELVAILPKKSLAAGMMVAERMRMSINSAPCLFNRHFIACSVSVGAAELHARETMAQ